jgi:rod shape-determining protein MreC
MISSPGSTFRTPPLAFRLLLFTALSVGIMYADHHGNGLRQIRSALDVITSPVRGLAALPARTGHWIADFFTSDTELRKQNQRLRIEDLKLQARLQKLAGLKSENDRLRHLLGSATRVADRAMVSELVEVSSEPATRTIVVDKGKGDGAYVGQPAIDAWGVVGQVTEANALDSRITLITDPGSAIPVQILRNGLRTIVFGTGASDKLDVPYLTPTADIRKGDLLISSGLGGRFPPLYPVARVTSIVKDPNEGFLRITATPAARLSYDREVLLVWPGKLKTGLATHDAGKDNSRKQGESKQ